MCSMAREDAEGACLCWQSQLQSPLLKQLARLGDSFSRLPGSSSRSASEIAPGVGLTVRLQHYSTGQMMPPVSCVRNPRETGCEISGP